MPPHPTNDGELRPTPRLSNAQQPSEGQLHTYQTGVGRFPYLADSGSFRTWPLDDLFPGIILYSHEFNCFAWSVGHTDRWIQPGTVEEMNDLYEWYNFEQCSSAEAEVELYRILDAPPTLTGSRGNVRQNTRALVHHAHRRDHPELDDPPGLGCSSKMGPGPLIAHNRRALEDTRNYDSGHPRIEFGSIYQHWRRGPEHPSFPGHRANLRPSTRHYPDDPIFERGYGRRPPGHPGNNQFLPGDNNSRNNDIPQSGSGRERHRAQNSRGRTPASYQPSMQYAIVTKMRAHDPIPPPKRAAKEAAARARDNMRRSVVREFDDRFRAWKRCWYSTTRVRASDARARCKVDEFEKLLDMGPQILPLVVDKLCDPDNFTGVFLYNALEDDLRYRIDRRDLLNYLVLQRQNNLIIDINERRRW